MVNTYLDHLDLCLQITQPLSHLGGLIAPKKNLSDFSSFDFTILNLHIIQQMIED